MVEAMDETSGYSLLESATMVFLMQLGFLLLETGSEQAKNVQGITYKNVLDTCVSSLCFWAGGYAVSTASFRALFLEDFEHLRPFFLHCTFASSAATIVGGAINGRTRLMAFMLCSAAVSTVVFPLAARWVWLDGGWLRELHALDFSGGLLVHGTGGCVSLVGALAVGRRAGHPAAHDLSRVGFGAALLWVGFIFFNMSSAALLTGVPDASPWAALAGVNTLLAGAAGGATAMALTRLQGGGYSLLQFANAMLAALASVTAGCAYMHPTAAVLVGASAAVVYRRLSALVDARGVDDAVDAFAVHCGGGVWGTLLVGVVADPAYVRELHGTEMDGYCGVVYGCDGRLLAAQLLASGAVLALAAGVAHVVFRGLQRQGALRIDAPTEAIGQDLAKHGCRGYPDFAAVNPPPPPLATVVSRRTASMATTASAASLSVSSSGSSFPGSVL